MVKLVFLVIFLVVLLQAQGRRRCRRRCRCPKGAVYDIFRNYEFGKKNHMLQFVYIQIKFKKQIKDTTV
jgi:hypothetical protein